MLCYSFLGCFTYWYIIIFQSCRDQRESVDGCGSHYLNLRLLPDILTCLEELSFTVSEKELTEPEKNVQSVRRLFEYLLEVLTGEAAV